MKIIYDLGKYYTLWNFVGFLCVFFFIIFFYFDNSGEFVIEKFKEKSVGCLLII